MMSVWSDLRIALRSLRRNLSFATVTILTLAVGIGATTAIFTVVDGVLLRPLPYRDASEIVTVQLGVKPGRGRPTKVALPPGGYDYFAKQNRSFSSFAGYIGFPIQLTLTGDRTPQELRIGEMTPDAFRLLGVGPKKGRLPTGDEGIRPEGGAPSGRPAVVLLSDHLWKQRYGSDPSILGRTVTLSGHTCTVIGVMPPGFNFPFAHTDAWMPIHVDPASKDFRRYYLVGLGRLRPGATVRSAEQDATRLIHHFGDVGFPASLLGYLDGSARITTLKDGVVGDARQPLIILLGAVGFLLLIACFNVVNLLLVRAEGRTRESAVRLALGAGRGRVVRHQMAESVILSLAGGVVGVGLAYVGVKVLLSMAPVSLPRLGDISIRISVLGFAAGLALLAGILTGWLPALRSSSRKSLAMLHEGGHHSTAGRSRRWTQSVLVVVEVTLALVLLVGCGLMARSFRGLEAVDPGFRAKHVLTFRVRPYPTEHPTSSEKMERFYAGLTQRLTSLPGVTAAGATTFLPLTGQGWKLQRVIDEFPPGPDEVAPSFDIRRVTAGYFEAMGIPVLAGRPINEDDADRELPSVVISRSVKQRYWPNESALGKSISTPNDSVAARVVGVVGDVHEAGLASPPDQVLYYPTLGSAGGPVDLTLYVAVHTTADPRAILPEVRQAVSQIDPTAPISEVRTMDAIVGDSMNRVTFTMFLLSLAAGIAVFLGAIGIYSIISYAVTRRTSEIGIRMALGADARRVARMVLLQGLGVAVVGIAAGVAGAAALGRVLASLLYGIGPRDPVTLVGGAALFLAIAAIATLVPAWRAARTEPVEALRAQ